MYEARFNLRHVFSSLLHTYLKSICQSCVFCSLLHYYYHSRSGFFACLYTPFSILFVLLLLFSLLFFYFAQIYISILQRGWDDVLHRIDTYGRVRAQCRRRRRAICEMYVCMFEWMMMMMRNNKNNNNNKNNICHRKLNKIK